MARIEKSIEIKAPSEKIWPMIQWERSPEWYAPFHTVEHKSKQRGVGEIVHISGEVAGMKAKWDAETTEQVVNEKAVWRSVGGDFTGFGSQVLSPTKTGTKLTMMMEYELPYSVLGKLIDKLRVSKALEKSFDVGLKKLKDMLET